jgi:translocation and assembly module TamB
MSASSARRWTRPLAIVGIVLLTLVVGVLALLQLPPVATWAMRRLITVVPLNPGYRLEVGRVSGDWVNRLALDEVRLLRNDEELARMDRLRVEYDLRRLRGAETRLRELTVDGARVFARREGDSWNLANALRRSADTTNGGGGFAVERLELRDVQLIAHLTPDSAVRVRGLALRARDLRLGEQVVLKVDQLNAAVAPPGSTRWFAVATRGEITADEVRLASLRIQTEQTQLAGRVVLPRDLDEPRLVDRLDLQLQARPLALADLATIVPAVTPEGMMHLEASATGGQDGLVTARLGARLDEATLMLNGVAPLAKGAADYRLHGTVRRLDPARLYRAAPAGSLNGRVQVELRGPTLARADGRVELRLTTSRLAGAAIERLRFHTDVRGGSAGVTLRAVLEQGTVTATGRMRPFDSVPQYRLSALATALPGSDAIARALAGETGEPLLDVRFELAGSGISPTAARLNGRVELTALRQDGERVPLGHARLALSRGRLEAHPELLVGNGRITAYAVAQLGDTLTYEMRRGTIERVDLGRLLADTTIAPVSGRFSLWGRGVAPDEAVATARIELDELRYGERLVEQVTGRIWLAGGSTRIQFGGTLQGGRLAIDANARPFDATKAFTIRRASLERADLGTFLGRPDLAGPVTLRASGSGRWRDELRFLRANLTVEPSRLGRLEVSDGSIDVRLSGERLTYEGSIRSNGGAFAVSGDGRPLADFPSFVVRRGRVDSIDVGALLGRPDLRTDVNARFTGSVTGRSADSMVGRLSVELLPSRVNQAELRSGRVALDFEGKALRADLRLEGREGEILAELTGRTGDAMQLHADGSLRLERLARWVGRADADGRLESRFALDAVGDSAGLVSLGGTVSAIGGIGDVRLHEAHLALRPASGAIQVDTLFIKSNVAALDGGGRVALREGAGADTLRLTGTAGDLTPLAALAGTDSVSLDSARVALTVSGPAWRWRLNGTADIHRILSSGNLAERVTMRAMAALDSTRLSTISGDLRLDDAAYGKIRIPNARLTGRYDSLLTVEADIAIGDSVRVATALRGVIGSDTIRAVLQRLDLTEGDRDWSLEQHANLELRPRVMVDGLALHTERRRIIVNGILDLRNSSDIALRLTNVDLDALRSVGLTPIGGRLDGWLRLTGPAAAPALEGSIGLGIRREDGREIGRIRTDLAWTREALRIDATAAPQNGGRLTVNGTLPWHLTLAPADTATAVGVARAAADTLALAVRADSFDLGVFQPLLPPESARELSGILVADAQVSGTPEAPRADGSVRVARAALTLPTIDVSYQRGELVGQLAGDELRIERFELRTGKKERLTAQGVVRLRPLTDPSLDITAELRNFRISNSPTLRSVASGRLSLEGTGQKPSLSGSLTLGRTDIIVGATEASPTVEKVELTPEDLRQVARHFGPAAVARADKGPGVVNRFRLDLDLRLPRRIWFRRKQSPKADIELSGQIRLRQEPGQPMQFFGRVEPVPGRGTLDVFGREFRLTGGEITLAGPADSTKLDVTAEYQVPTEGGPEDEGVLIEVAAAGPVDSLTLEFTGDPAMGQDDLVSYIVTGKPASDNPLAEREAGGESAGEAGAAVALSRLTQNLSSTAEEGLGLDVFQIRQEGLHGLTLTAGRYIGSRIFLSLHLPIELGSEAEQIPGTNLGPSYELEYQLAARRWLRANIRGGNVPPRFTLRSRYAY